MNAYDIDCKVVKIDTYLLDKRVCFLGEGFGMNINIMWDEEALVWIAECEKLGLVLEAGSYDALIEKIKSTIPELIELNNIKEKMFVINTKERQMVYA